MHRGGGRRGGPRPPPRCGRRFQGSRRAAPPISAIPADPDRQLARARVLGHRLGGFAIGGARAVQRRLEVGGVESACAGSIRKNIPPRTSNLQVVVHVLTALGKSPLTVRFDSWDLASRRSYSLLADLLALDEEFDLGLLEKKGPDRGDAMAIHAEIFGFDDRSAGAFLRMFFGRGPWKKGDVRLEVRPAVLSRTNPYAPICFFLRRAPKTLGRTEADGIGLNAHARASGEAYAGSCWIQGHRGFALEGNDLPEPDAVVGSLRAKSRGRQVEIGRLVTEENRRQWAFGERMRGARFGGGTGEEKTKTPV